MTATISKIRHFSIQLMMKKFRIKTTASFRITKKLKFDLNTRVIDSKRLRVWVVKDMAMLEFIFLP